jgi:catalase (peroxidase I)
MTRYRTLCREEGASTNIDFIVDVNGFWTGALRWTGTRVDLIFGSNSQLRALAEKS